MKQTNTRVVVFSKPPTVGVKVEKPATKKEKAKDVDQMPPVKPLDILNMVHFSPS